MLTEAEIAGMRETATAALPDRCSVTRSSPTGSLNTSTAVWTPTAATTIYVGSCRVRPPDAEDLEVLFGDTEITKQRFVVTFPYDCPALHVDDVVTVTDSSDGLIVNRPFRVTGHASGSWQIDRRAALEAVEE